MRRILKKKCGRFGRADFIESKLKNPKNAGYGFREKQAYQSIRNARKRG